MHNEKILVPTSEVEKIFERLAFQIIEKYSDLDNTYIVGIRRRGVSIANKITECLDKYGKKYAGTGVVDITLYRDDLTKVADVPIIHGTELNFDINDKNIILVDDVLYTGRTIKAALEAIYDYGRPANIQLLVLVDRGHRELPIQADFIGKTIPTASNEVIHVKVKEYDKVDDCIAISRREV